MSNPLRINSLLLFTFLTFFWSSQFLLLYYFFLLAPTVLFLPFRVLALVFVRCPLVGKPRLCRKPRYDPISISLLIFI